MIAAGGAHSLALRADSTVIGWGNTNYGQINPPADLSNVVAIAADYHHSLALKTDGTVVGWGRNQQSQTNVPAGLSNVIAIAACYHQSLALKADGTVVAWGSNFGGERNVPANLSNVVAIAAGGYHNLALKSDGTVVGWGNATYGQATVPSGAYSLSLPVAVSGTVNTNVPGSYLLTYNTTNALGAAATATRTVHVTDTLPPVLTLLGDNPLFWQAATPFVDPGVIATDLCGGDLTGSGLVTNLMVNTSVPGYYTNTFTATDASGLVASTNRTVIVATAPAATTSLAVDLTTTSATLQGNVVAGLLSATAWFEWGTSTAYGNTTSVTGFSAGDTAQAVSQPLSELVPGVTYHFRLVATNAVGTTLGADMTFATLSTNASLAGLALSAGTISPTFSPEVAAYAALVGANVSNLSVIPTAADLNATIQARINGGSYVAVASGAASSPLALNVGDNIIEVRVTAQDTVTVQTYTIGVALDATPPTISTCASNRTVVIGFGEQATLPDLTGEIVASDNLTNTITLTQSPPAGTLMSPGTNMVTLTATDGAGNQTTCQALCTVVQTVWGNALSFDGTNDSVTIPSGTWFSNDLTIEVWVYERSYANESRILDFGNSTSANVVFGLSYYTSGYMWFQVNGSSRVYWNYPVPLNRWVHLAVTLQGTSARLYTNGVLVASGSAYVPQGILRTNNYIGRGPSGNYANALFDDLRVWNVARTADQIREGMRHPFDGTESNLVAYWKFNEGLQTNTASATPDHTNAWLSGPAWTNSTVPEFPPTVATLAATNLAFTGGNALATLNGTVNPNCLPVGTWFQYGTTTSYGSNTPLVNLGDTNIVLPHSQAVSGLISNAPYHFRLVATNSAGTNFGSDFAFLVLNTNTFLSALTLNAVTLSPAFSSTRTNYVVVVPGSTNSILVTATSADTNATLQVRVNGGEFAPLVSGSPSAALPLNIGANPIEVLITAQDTVTFRTYTVMVNVDATPPTITACPTNRILGAVGGCMANLPNLLGELLATDNLTNSLFKSQYPPAGTALGRGTTNILFTVWDSGNNSATCQATITVADLTPPSFTSPMSLIVTSAPGECSAIANFTLTAIDNCDPDPVESSVPPSGTVLPFGTNHIYCTAVDASGNVANRTMLVSVYPSRYGPSPNWTPHETNRIWVALASSANGSNLVAAVGNGQLYTSGDAGETWTARESTRYWNAVASSDNGSNLVASVNGGYLYVSKDAGATWIARGPAQPWRSLASSADGTKLVACAYQDWIYTSTDSGTNWTARSGDYYWLGVASSADGRKLVAVANGQTAFGPGYIYTSSDYGVSWTQRSGAGTRYWACVASSSDGTKLVAADEGYNGGGGLIYTSTDSGATWTARESSRNWNHVASSADGTMLLACAASGVIYSSMDSGVTWTPRSLPIGNWTSVAMSSDGMKHFATLSGGQIYISGMVPVPLTSVPSIFGATNQVLDASTTNGIVATFSVTASNLCQTVVPVTCTPPSGTVFPLGTNTVTCRAVDALGTPGTATFTIWVRTKPTVGPVTASLAGTNTALGLPRVSFSARVTPNGLPTFAGFQYGLTTSYGTNNPPAILPANYTGSDQVLVLEVLGGATYHCRAFASNSIGVSYSDDHALAVPAIHAAGDVNIDGIVDADEFSQVLAGYHGSVSQAQLNTVLSNYFSSSPWLYITNTAGLGGANVTFALSNSTAGAYSVLMSTNLSDWEYLGPATPRFEFTDTNAPALPQRYYRLRWP